MKNLKQSDIDGINKKKNEIEEKKNKIDKFIEEHKRNMSDDDRQKIEKLKKSNKELKEIESELGTMSNNITARKQLDDILKQDKYKKFENDEETQNIKNKKLISLGDITELKNKFDKKILEEKSKNIIIKNGGNMIQYDEIKNKLKEEIDKNEDLKKDTGFKNTVEGAKNTGELLEKLTIDLSFDKEISLGEENNDKKELQDKQKEIEALKTSIENGINNTQTDVSEIAKNIIRFKQLYAEAKNKKEAIVNNASVYVFDPTLNRVRINDKALPFDAMSEADNKKTNKKGYDKAVSQAREHLSTVIKRMANVINDGSILSILQQAEKKTAEAKTFDDIEKIHNGSCQEIAQFTKKEYGVEAKTFDDTVNLVKLAEMNKRKEENICTNYSDGVLHIIPNNDKDNILKFDLNKLTEDMLKKISSLDKEGRLSKTAKNTTLSRIYEDVANKIVTLKKNNPAQQNKWNFNDTIGQYLGKDKEGNIEADFENILKGAQNIEKDFKKLKVERKINNTEELSHTINKEFNSKYEKDIQTVNGIRKDALSKFIKNFDQQNQILKFVKDNYPNSYKDKNGNDVFANVKTNDEFLAAINKLDASQQYDILERIGQRHPAAFASIDDINQQHINNSIDKIKNSQKVFESVKEVQDQQQEILNNLSNNFQKLVENRKTALDYYKQAHPIKYFFLKLFTLGMGTPDDVKKIDQQASKTLSLYAQTCESYNEIVMEAIGKGGSLSMVKEQINKHLETYNKISNATNKMSELDKIASNIKNTKAEELKKKADEMLKLDDNFKKEALTEINERGQDNNKTMFDIKTVIETGNTNALSSGVSGKNKSQEQQLMNM